MAVDKILLNKILEFIEDEYQPNMGKTQIKIIAEKILEAIKSDPEFPTIKASVTKGGDSTLLNTKIKQINSKLVKNPKSPWDPSFYLKIDLTTRQKLVFNCIRGKPPSIREVLKDVELLKAVLWKPNPELMNEARSLVQKMFIDMHTQFNQKNLSNTEHFHAEVVIGDLLSLIPFLRPQDNEKFLVPVRIEDKWELIEYTVDRIELTPGWMGSPLVAYGLRPSDPKLPPLLLFKGTTYPTDEGASLSFLTDINPFGSVGSYAFSIGKDKIQKWLAANTSEKKAVIYGKSLGGAQAWRTAIHFPDHVDKVMAYGAPGFSPWEQRELNHMIDQQTLLEKESPQINIFCQTNDPVPYSDLASKRGVNYYEIVPERIQDNLVGAHAFMYSTQKKSAIVRMEPQVIGNLWKRTAVTIARLAGSLLFFAALNIHILKTAVNFSFHVVSKLFRSNPLSKAQFL